MKKSSGLRTHIKKQNKYNIRLEEWISSKFKLDQQDDDKD